MNKRKIVNLGVLEGDIYGENMVWKSKDKSLSWNFAYYMPVLIRDTLRNLAIDPAGCPGQLVDEFGGDVDMACIEWSKRLNKLADKFDYASKIFDDSQFLSDEDQKALDEYFEETFKFDKNDKKEFIIKPNNIPDHISEIYKKEKEIVNDMEKTLKEALVELGEIWYNLWD